MNEPLIPAEQEETTAEATLRKLTAIRRCLVGILIILLGSAFYFASGIILPMAMAFLFALVLSPVVRWFRRRGVPEPISAFVLVLALTSSVLVGGYALSGPAADWLKEGPRIAAQFRQKVDVVLESLHAMRDVTKGVDEIASNDDPGVQRVVVTEPGLLSRAAYGVPDLAAKIGLTVVLLFFLLCSVDLFAEKMIKVLPTLHDKKRALRIARDVEHELSRYLLSIMLINLGLGVVISLAMWAYGMPNAALWGAAAAVLNFIPYLGALAGIIMVFMAGLLTFDTLGQALLPPATYFVVAILEGQILTPAIVGRRMELNTVAVFAAIAFWGWLWGIVGALIAVPILVVTKVVADNIDGMAAFGEFLAARDAPAATEPAAEPARTEAVDSAPATIEAVGTGPARSSYS
jgi:predicted PurR-regulated permease PerM